MKMDHSMGFQEIPRGSAAVLSAQNSPMLEVLMIEHSHLSEQGSSRAGIHLPEWEPSWTGIHCSMEPFVLRSSDLQSWGHEGQCAKEAGEIEALHLESDEAVWQHHLWQVRPSMKVGPVVLHILEKMAAFS